MNDIASASDKGRRTIYTYFKNKRDIFNAVIEQETDKLMETLRMILDKPISPAEKLSMYIECRFETMREIVSRNGSLKAGFFRDVRKVDRARKLVSQRKLKYSAVSCAKVWTRGSSRFRGCTRPPWS